MARAARASCSLFVATLAWAMLCNPAAAATLEVLHKFSGTDGSDPTGGLAVDTDTGVLYGTTKYGGTGGGTVFSLTPPAPGNTRWKYQVIYTFKGGFDGSQPETGLAVEFNPSGLGKVLYGTTHSGSSLCACGTIFRLDPPDIANGDWQKTTLHEFSGDNFDGTTPNSIPYLGSDNYFYGTAEGATGTVYRMDRFDIAPFTVLYNPGKGIGNFVGYHPQGIVRLYLTETLYGTAFNGDGAGTLFSIDADGNAAVVHAFSGPDGANPSAPPIFGLDNTTLYGVTLQGGNPKDCPNNPGCGTVWRASKRLKVLHSFRFFTHAKDGMWPMSPLVLDEATGTFYGTTYYGGTGTECGGINGSCGTIFSIDNAGNYQTLWEFPRGGPASPEGQLVFYDGALYGTSYDGGKWCADHNYLGCGTVWKLTP